MDQATAQSLLERLRQKKAEMLPAFGGQNAPTAAPTAAPPAVPATTPETAFANAVEAMHAAKLRTAAFQDIKHMGLLSLGLGALGAGGVGLLNSFRHDRPKKTKGGPVMLPLPYPADEKTAGFLDGAGWASNKMGLPWYAPAMMLTGLGGLGVGWKGTDALIQARRKAESEEEMERARREFHDALLGQYDKPLEARPALADGGKGRKVKAAEDNTMVKVAEELDALWTKIEGLLDRPEIVTKQAFELSDMVPGPNAAGTAAGLYGTYAGLSGLLAGAFMYDRANKRSRRAIIEKAQQRRARRQFAQRPSEIFAVPEPVTALPRVGAAGTLRQDPNELSEE